MGVDGQNSPQPTTAGCRGERMEEVNMCLECQTYMSLLMTVNLSASQGALRDAVSCADGTG